MQTIFRVHKNRDNPYFMMDKRPIENPNLSYKAKGILSYLLSRPDDWKINLQDLINRSTDGRDGVKSGLDELALEGHVRIVQERDDAGRFCKVVYEVYEQPLTENPVTVLPEAENPVNTNNNITKKEDTNNNKQLYTEFPILTSQQFAEKWKEWLDYRKERRLKLTDITKRKQLKLLSKYHINEACQMLEQSMVNGWQGVFPIRHSSPKVNTDIWEKV